MSDDKNYEEHEVRAARGTIAVYDRFKREKGTCLLLPHRADPVNDPSNYNFLQSVGETLEGFGLKPMFMVASELGIHFFWFWKYGPEDNRRTRKMVEAGLLAALQDYANVLRPLRVSNGKDLMKNLATGRPPFLAYNRDAAPTDDSEALH